MTKRIVIHNHVPRRARDEAGRAVSREEEERNRDRVYKDTGIRRIGRDGGPGSGPQPGGGSSHKYKKDDVVKLRGSPKQFRVVGITSNGNYEVIATNGAEQSQFVSRSSVVGEK